MTSRSLFNKGRVSRASVREIRNPVSPKKPGFSLRSESPSKRRVSRTSVRLPHRAPVLTLCFLCSFLFHPTRADDPLSWSRDVRPILASRCFKCHGPDDNARQADLRLDRFDDATRDLGDRRAIAPGQPVKSEAIRRITSGDPDERMPPPDSKLALTPAEIDVLRRWIEQGAEYEQHWSFIPPRRPTLPSVSDGAWCRNAIDRFVRSRLDREGLNPSPPADDHTLLRRVYLDLIGLPPAPHEIDAYLADASPDRYERLVDRLLARPEYGERWARPWLDLARYSDTNGYEKDRDRSIWPYRDWVIAALNDDMPFDRFTVEQIAGDLVEVRNGEFGVRNGSSEVRNGEFGVRNEADSVPGPFHIPNSAFRTRDQRARDLLVATGFHRNTMLNEEGGVDVEEFRFAAVVDRLATTGTVWLGLTLGCAQCHTHKYDPLSHAEYYSLFAFLDNCDEPELSVVDPEIERRRAAIQQEIDAAEAQLEAKFPSPDGTDAGRSAHFDLKFAEWRQQMAAKSVPWTPLRPVAMASRDHATMTRLGDDSVLVSGDIPNNDVYDMTFDLPAGRWTALRLEVLPHDSLPNGGPGRAIFDSGAGAKGDFLLSEISASVVSPLTTHHSPLTFHSATESHALNPTRSAAAALDGNLDTGWSIGQRTGEPHQAVFPFTEPFDADGTSQLHVRLVNQYIHQMTIGRFRISATNAAGQAIQPDANAADPAHKTESAPGQAGKPDLRVTASGLLAEIEAVLVTPDADRTPAQREQLKRHYLSIAPELADDHKRIAALRKSLPEHPTTLVVQERPPRHARTTHIHHRGEFLKLTDSVEPEVPDVLHDLPEGAARDRLTFARWLVAEDNPLVARVVMNRAWQSFFGRGIVATPEDFGTQGALPTHPELLDWLAVEFMHCGWSQKAMHRLIVTSSTYRQASGEQRAESGEQRAEEGNSILDPASSTRRERDPSNELLARGPRFRIDAEIVRDVALAAAGLLDRRLGGPSVYPPQPPGVIELAYGNAQWPTATGPDRYRRGLYTFAKRTAPYAMTTQFGAPSGETCTARRERSNTPLQALTVLNDTVFVEAARALARLALDEPLPDDTARVHSVFRRTLTRDPSEAETAALESFLRTQRARLGSGELNAGKLVGTEGETPAGADVIAWAAWTTLCRAVLNLDEAITKE